MIVFDQATGYVKTVQQASCGLFLILARGSYKRVSLLYASISTYLSSMFYLFERTCFLYQVAVREWLVEVNLLVKLQTQDRELFV